MAKYKLNRKEKSKLRKQREIDLLVALDLDLVHSYTDQDRGRIFMENLPWWKHPPSQSMLGRRRNTPEYAERRASLVRNDELVEKITHWASQLFACGKDSAVQGYEEIIRGGPKAFKRTWLDAARDIRNMAGLHDRDAGLGRAAIAFLEGLGIGAGQVMAQKNIDLQREEDGTVIPGDFKVLPD